MTPTTKFLTAATLLAGVFTWLSTREDVVQAAAKSGSRLLSGKVTGWVATAIRKTRQHEGGFGSVNANSDGNGVSYGILQWTQRGGALGPLLAAAKAADPDAFAADFGPYADELLRVTAATSKEARMAPVGGVVLWDPSWVARFAGAGQQAYMQNAQLHMAAYGAHMDAAVHIAKMLDTTTERSLILIFNRTVHQGVGGARACAGELTALWQAHPETRPATVNARLAQFAWICADRFRFRPEEPEVNSSLNWHPASVWLDAKGNPTPYARRGKQELVGKELRDIGQTDFTLHVVDAPPMTLHARDAGGMTNLYNLITYRSSDILLDPTLRDAEVDLDTRV